MSTRFTTRLDEDDYGDLILTIPYEVCEELGWNTDSELVYDAVDGKFTLKKLND
jgi:bifunctional DNA-binding transcriptional regulator/antitoxin component of YhaV-PrlF toxin-antitoxin module|tara:strand:- start:3975 stop:4136 length:162 start_codon:yes stop_codon:yes gene_type:complete